MQSRSLLVLAVVAATVTAGCAAVGSFGPEQGETLTPVDVASPTPGATQSDAAAPGTGADVGSQEALSDVDVVARHSTALTDRSFRLRTTQRVVVNGSTVRRTTYSRTVASGGTAYVATLNRTNSDYPRNVTISDIDTYYNGTVLATRYRTTDDSPRPRYTFSRDPAVRTDELAAQDQLRGFLRAYEIRRRVGTSTTPGTFLEGDRILAPTAIHNPIGTSRPRNGTLSMAVRDDEIVTLGRIEYTVTVGENRTGRVVRTIRIGDVGTATVDRPAWVETAVETAGYTGRRND